MSENSGGISTNSFIPLARQWRFSYESVWRTDFVPPLLNLKHTYIVTFHPRALNTSDMNVTVPNEETCVGAWQTSAYLGFSLCIQVSKLWQRLPLHKDLDYLIIQTVAMTVLLGYFVDKCMFYLRSTVYKWMGFIYAHFCDSAGTNWISITLKSLLTSR